MRDIQTLLSRSIILSHPYTPFSFLLFHMAPSYPLFLLIYFVLAKFCVKKFSIVIAYYFILLSSISIVIVSSSEQKSSKCRNMNLDYDRSSQNLNFCYIEKFTRNLVKQVCPRNQFLLFLIILVVN